jgi:hypothetical protein
VTVACGIAAVALLGFSGPVSGSETADSPFAGVTWARDVGPGPDRFVGGNAPEGPGAETPRVRAGEGERGGGTGLLVTGALLVGALGGFLTARRLRGLPAKPHPPAAAGREWAALLRELDAVLRSLEGRRLSGHAAAARQEAASAGARRPEPRELAQELAAVGMEPEEIARRLRVSGETARLMLAGVQLRSPSRRKQEKGAHAPSADTWLAEGEASHDEPNA